MLELKNISKSYKTKELLLNNISVCFRKTEFVSILGPGGSGKTTFLNIIGGIEKCNEGEVILNGISTKNFSDKKWDSYRNKNIGFIFQDNVFISHLSILDNVEIGMSLTKTRKKERREKAINALMKVGLKEIIDKKPDQLSKEQLQRVAIARALANDPKIILADEPTENLDAKSSFQIMNLLSEIADDKLVIMATHNDMLAQEYSDRIIEIEDGEIINDSHPLKNNCVENNINSLKQTKITLQTAFKLSLNNIYNNKILFILSSFISSIAVSIVGLNLLHGYITYMRQNNIKLLKELLIIVSFLLLLLSMLIIGMRTHISAIKKTKEINMLRILGARKKDIARLFYVETLIEGIVIGIFSIITTLLILCQLNNIAGLENIACFSIVHITILMLVSVLLTYIANVIPTIIASNKKMS
jgi:putative ABC transport system permease protein